MFPVTYSTFDEIALQNFINENYHFDEIKKCRLLLRGMNDTFLIETSSNKYVFRVYRSSWRNKISEVAFEVELLKYLKDKGLPVSYPISATNKQIIQRFDAPEGPRFGVLFTFAEGVVQPMDSTDACFNYGKAVGNLHNKSAGFRTMHERPSLDLSYLIEKPLEIIKPFMEHRPNDYEYIYNLGSLLSKRVKELHQQGLDWGICHGDLHGENAHLKDNIFTHYDFDISGYGWRAYDLAVFRFTLDLSYKNENEEKSTELWESFLNGYQSIRKLSQNDIDSIPLFCGIRQIWLMKLTLKYFRDLDITGSADAEEQYFNDELEHFEKMKILTETQNSTERKSTN